MSWMGSKGKGNETTCREQLLGDIVPSREALWGVVLNETTCREQLLGHIVPSKEALWGVVLKKYLLLSKLERKEE